MSAGEERDREAHFVGGYGGGKDTVKQDAGMLDLTVFVRPHKLKPFWILVKLSFPSLPLTVFFQKRSLLYDPCSLFFGFCVRKCVECLPV